MKDAVRDVVGGGGGLLAVNEEEIILWKQCGGTQAEDIVIEASVYKGVCWLRMGMRMLRCWGGLVRGGGVL